MGMMRMLCRVINVILGTEWRRISSQIRARQRPTNTTEVFYYVLSLFQIHYTTCIPAIQDRKDRKDKESEVQGKRVTRRARWRASYKESEVQGKRVTRRARWRASYKESEVESELQGERGGE